MTDLINRNLPPSYRPSDSEDVPVMKPSCGTCEYFCIMPDMAGGEAKPYCHRWSANVEVDDYCDAYEPTEEEEGGEEEMSPTSQEDKMPMNLETNSVAWLAVKKDDKRSIAYSNLEFRSMEEGGNTIVGYAAVWDSPSEPMPFIEYVKRGAFTKTLKDGADVRLLIDHAGVPLARTKSGTMTLTEDERGLRVEADLDPTNPDAARVMSAMRRGDLSQMSFAFRTIKDSWSDNGETRELREVQLFDVSVVTFPAYEETVAELRSRTENATVKTNSQLRLRQQQIALAKYRSR